jgi:hypothetical protein
MALIYDGPTLVKQQLTHAPSATGLSVPGTAASDTVLLRIPIVNSVTFNGSARIRMTTGGTAAGPTITFGKSLAGTGAVAAFGTQAFGTDANGTTKTTSLTSTDFDFGDELIVSNLAGTAASTPVIVFSLPYNMTLK